MENPNATNSKLEADLKRLTTQEDRLLRLFQGLEHSLTGVVADFKKRLSQAMDRNAPKEECLIGHTCVLQNAYLLACCQYYKLFCHSQINHAHRGFRYLLEAVEDKNRDLAVILPTLHQKVGPACQLLKHISDVKYSGEQNAEMQGLLETYQRTMGPAPVEWLQTQEPYRSALIKMLKAQMSFLVTTADAMVQIAGDASEADAESQAILKQFINIAKTHSDHVVAMPRRNVVQVIGNLFGIGRKPGAPKDNSDDEEPKVEDVPEQGGPK